MAAARRWPWPALGGPASRRSSPRATRARSGRSRRAGAPHTASSPRQGGKPQGRSAARRKAPPHCGPSAPYRDRIPSQCTCAPAPWPGARAAQGMRPSARGPHRPRPRRRPEAPRPAGAEPRAAGIVPGTGSGPCLGLKRRIHASVLHELGQRHASLTVRALAWGRGDCADSRPLQVGAERAAADGGQQLGLEDQAGIHVRGRSPLIPFVRLPRRA